MFSLKIYPKVNHLLYKAIEVKNLSESIRDNCFDFLKKCDASLGCTIISVLLKAFMVYDICSRHSVTPAFSEPLMYVSVHGV